jgi:hypothetical protein
MKRRLDLPPLHTTVGRSTTVSFGGCFNRRTNWRRSKATSLLPFQTAVTGLACIWIGGRSLLQVDTAVRGYFWQSLKRLFIFGKSSKIKYKKINLSLLHYIQPSPRCVDRHLGRLVSRIKLNLEQPSFVFFSPEGRENSESGSCGTELPTLHGVPGEECKSQELHKLQGPDCKR